MNMTLRNLIIDPSRLWIGESRLDAPVAFIDLDAAPIPSHDPAEAIVLPPCPVIGIGDPAHPLAALLDTIAQPPASAESIASQVLAKPHAAAVIVQLLRLMPSLPMDSALTAESLAYGMLQGSAEHAAWQQAQQGRGNYPNTVGRVLLERSGNSLVITLDNAENGNAIDRTMRDALSEAFGLAALDQEIKAVSLRANGCTFSLGAALTEFGTTTDPATAHDIRARTLPARAIAPIAHKLDVHVQGGCVGAGLELAAFARRFTATPGAWFQLPELAMGILPGAGGCVSLTRRIGRQRTAALILSGKRLSARHALAWGLVDAIVDTLSSDPDRANIG